MPSRVYVTVGGCPSVYFVSVPVAAACGEFAAESTVGESIDSCGRAAGAMQQVPAQSSNGAAARRSAANAGSVTFTADGGGRTQTC